MDLPVFGVGLGHVELNGVWILINNRLPYGEPDRIVVMPVAARADGSRKWRLVRPNAPNVQDGPTPKDLEASGAIMLAELERTAEPEKQPVVQFEEKGSTYRRAGTPGMGNLDQTLRDVRQNVILHVARELWHEHAQGLLFMLLFGKVVPETHEDIAKAIAAVLNNEDVSRCVVPKRSIEVLTSRPPSYALETAGPLCFALASCQYSPGIIDSTPPLDGFARVEVGPADRSYERLVRRYLQAEEAGALRPDLLLLTGDQVYVDATAGLFDPATIDGRFLRPYEQLYSSAFVQHVTRQIPVAMMLDDHELRDNWENESDAQRDLELGRKAYRDFQRNGGPLDDRPVDHASMNVAFAAPVILDKREEETCWAKLSFQSYEFFIADTRTQRQKRTAQEYADKTIMDADQFEALKNWLLKGPDSRPRFVMSPSILIPRRLSTVGSDPAEPSQASASVLLSDAWDGYPHSFQTLFAFIAHNKIRNVIFLSGDEHLCCVSSATLQGATNVVVHSIHSSGLYAPYSFANAIEADFVPHERLTVPASTSIAGSTESVWNIETTFAPQGQGFALIRVVPEPECFRVQIKFSLHRGDQDELTKGALFHELTLLRHTPSS